MEGNNPQSNQEKMDLADTVANTPNYLLEKTIHTEKRQGENAQESIQRVANEVGRLFEVLDTSTQAHTEDVRSEKAIGLAHKPQEIFVSLLNRSLRLDSGREARQMRLSAGLVEANVVDSLSINTEDGILTQEGLIQLVQENRNAKFIQKIGRTMELCDDYQKADQGIRRYGELKRIGESVLEGEFSMPAEATQMVLGQIEPTIQATIDLYADYQREAVSKRTANSLARMAERAFNGREDVLQEVKTILTPFQIQNTTA